MELLHVLLPATNEETWEITKNRNSESSILSLWRSEGYEEHRVIEGQASRGLVIRILYPEGEELINKSSRVEKNCAVRMMIPGPPMQSPICNHSPSI